MSRRVAVNLFAFGLVFLLMLWWAVNNIITFDFIERPYEIEGEFAATAGVASNSEVAFLGVNYGSVRSVEPVVGGVMITMSIDRDKQIPEGSVARIFRKSAVGEPYIDFQPPAGYSGGGPFMQEGDPPLPMSQTQVPLEFSELLRSASRLLGSVDPDQTRTLVHELAVALAGRGDALRGLTVDSDALVQTLVDNAELLDSLSSNSTRLTRTVAQHRHALSSAIIDLAAVGDSLRTVEPDTRVLLERGSELLGEAADLVDDTEQDLDCILSDLDELISVTTTDENLQHLAATLQRLPQAFEYVFMTRDDEPGGLWVRVNLIANPENPPEQYVPPRELPAVPEIPACVSTLSSSDLRFESGPASDPVVVSRLPATGGSPQQVLALVVLATAALGLLARRADRTRS